jgi:L-asparagine transporter-like permease
MAERGFLPKFMARRSKHDTPSIGILMSSMGVLSLASLNFVEVGAL